LFLSTVHSDREAVFASTRNLVVIPAERLFFETNTKQEDEIEVHDEF